MASNIDITRPVTGSPQTQSVRDNFTAARDEIEALQDRVDLTEADIDTLETKTQTATAAVAGIIELATQAEVNAGTDTSRAVTPDTLAGVSKFFLRFQNDNGDLITPPSSSTSAGTVGQVAWGTGGNPMYICVATNTWIRFPVTVSF